MPQRPGHARPHANLLSILACAYLLALATLSGCGSAVTPEQQAVISRIQELGGKISFAKGGYKIDLAGTPVEDKYLENFKLLGTIREINLTGTKITDVGLAHLEPITTLKYLMLERTLISHEAADEFEKSHPGLDLRH